jgi:ATP-binding cassette subfamily B protein
MDCGPACLRMITKYYGKSVPLKFLKEISYQTREGVSLLGLTQAADRLGYQSIAAKLSYQELLKHVDKLPFVIHWNENHFVVLYKVRKNPITGKLTFFVADPSHGHVRMSEERFLESWLKSKEKGVCLLLFPGEDFESVTAPAEPAVGMMTFFKYVRSFRKELLLVTLGMFVISLVTLILPFLTQLLIDEGIQPKNMDVVATILIAQIVLFLGVMSTEVVRNTVLLYLGTRINITIISDFLKKLLQLPLHFFDTKQMGDINQRIQDHDRIESFLTSQSLLTLFSLINFSVFFIVLLQYNTWIVTIYFVLTFLAILWSLAFMQRRKQLDYQKFLKRSENQDVVFEMVSGIEEIKLNGFEDFNRNKWEGIQFHLFNVNMRVLRLDQMQRVGFDMINQLKNIIVTFVAAREVIQGSISLGALLAISYIIGQMNSPVNQIIQFFLGYQDAKISLERLLEVELHHDEEYGKTTDGSKSRLGSAIEVEVRNLSFQYEGPASPYVLQDVELNIEKGKVTAIVGESGSGKTTLMRLLLGYYAPTSGEILINGQSLGNMSPKKWREQCGTVLQDGYLFSDTIERNIAMGADEIDAARLDYSLKMACLHEFVHALPLGLKTKVGRAGIGLSGGQKQRLFIARAIYKNPSFILFDEATSALDAKTERSIQENLYQFLAGKTAVIIAHRLSTVQNADQIIVLDKGKIVERGIHASLVESKGIYYNLVKNQLNLGN